MPCSVVYKKPTEKVADKTLWTAEAAEGYCEAKAEAFIAKLESWKWTCAKQAEAKKDAAAESSEAAPTEAATGGADAGATATGQ